VQNRANYPANALWRGAVIGKEWETHYFAFAANNEIPEGQGTAKLALGERRQVIEVADFQVYRFPVGFDIFSAPRMAATYEGREADAPWRAEAEARIAKLRQGTLNVRVVDADGKPVEGAKIRVAMKRHLFGFGSAVDVNMLSGLGSKLTPQDEAKYRAVTDELFSRVVPENGLRVRNIDADINPEKPWEADTRLRTKTAVLWTLQWAKDRRMTSRGHYLVWCYAEDWAKTILKTGTPADLLATYDRHAKFVIPFVADYVCEWDALNHPVPFNEPDALYSIFNPDIYSELYKKLRPLTPLPLIVNEDTFNPERTDGFEKHVRRMIELGATPDGCGFQSHYHDYSIPGMDEIWRTYDRFAVLVKQLTVTEYDFQTLDDQLHADHMRDMLTLAFSHPQMTGFVIWGFWEKRHWKPTAAIFKVDWTERPAVKVWRDLVKTKWWTNADLTSGADGKASTPGFFGWYDITVEHGGKTKTLEVKHATSGSAPTVKLP
jgi:endo-1,4-beta-xylanase